MKKDKCYQSSCPAKQLLIINRNLRAAAVTKERSLRLATRYILTDKLHNNRAYTGRLPLFERQGRASTSSVGSRERRSDGNERSHQRSGAIIGTKRATIFHLSSWRDACDKFMRFFERVNRECDPDANIDKYDATVQVCTDQNTAQAFVQGIQEQELQVDDSEYFERMVEEVKDAVVDMTVDDDVVSRRQSPLPPMMTKARV
ncbi:hypothetical protein Aduo_018548 [Ancylostoma duodenale]